MLTVTIFLPTVNRGIPQLKNGINSPGNLKQSSLTRVLSTINHRPAHDILDQRLDSLLGLVRASKRKDQFPRYGDRISAEDRRGEERCLSFF